MTTEYKVEGYQTKEQTVFTIKSKNYYPNAESFLANGKPLIPTFLSKWYQVDGKLESVVRIQKVQCNIRYELINTDMYNEKIPLIIDEHSKEKYLPLIDGNLYERKFETRIEETSLDCVVSEVDMDIRFDVKTAKEYFSRTSFAGHRQAPYLITLVEFSVVDQCLVPRPLLDLTRPCVLAGDALFQVLTDMAAVKFKNNCRITEHSDNRFKVMTSDKRTTFIEWTCYHATSCSTNVFNNFKIVGNNFQELMQKVDAFIDYLYILIQTDSSPLAFRIAVDELGQGKDFRKDK